MARRPLFNRPGAPLTPRTFYVLLALNSSELDATAVIDEVAMSSAGRVRLSIGTLGPTIKRLIGSGLVAHDGGRFALTHQGRLVLADELERMERAVRIARSKRP
jgi:predicted transcriptional regulator